MNTEKLFKKDFLLVLIGQIISMFGNAILRFALPLYLLRETGSSTLFGVVNATSFIPMIVLSMVGGVLADRVNKRNIMVILDFFTAALIAIFYLCLGRLPIVPLFIVMLMLLYGISGTYQPSVQASIPVLVHGDKLMAGNAVISQVDTLASLVGPVIGGMLFGMWGIKPILLISIGCFTFSAVMEIFITIPFTKRKTDKGIFAIAASDLKESYMFVKNEKPIFISMLIIVIGLNLVLSAMIMVGLPVIIVNILKMSDSMLGFSQGALAFGGLAGGLTAGLMAGKIKLQKCHWFLVLCSLGVAFMAVPLVLNLSNIASYWIITAMGFLSMAASAVFSIQMLTTLQKHTPSHLIGKVMAVSMGLSMCAMPIGQAIYGILFDVLGGAPWIPLVISAVLSLVISFYSKNTFNKMHDM